MMKRSVTTLAAILILTVAPRYSTGGSEKPYYEKEFSVTEKEGNVEVDFDLKKGDRILITGQGNIWAGNWFTGTNGPEGWNWTDNDNKFPLPGSHPYALLVMIDDKYRYVGSGVEFDYTGQGCKMLLKINDDRHGNGDGSFLVKLKVYRDPPKPKTKKSRVVSGSKNSLKTSK